MSQASDLDFPAGPARGWSAFLGILATTVAVASFHLWFYGDALGGFFFLDDYWELTKTNSIAVTSPSEFLQLFEPFPSFLLYRPLSTLVFYHLLRVAFGHDPFSYHATLMAFHVLNAVLVYVVARKLFRSSGAGFFAGFIYAMAPGHAVAVYWMALFTMTGTAFFYFAALAAWVCGEGRWRIPVTWLLFIGGMLSSEHAISLPVTLTALSLLVDRERDWRKIAREQAAFYFVAVSYAVVKLYYIRYHLPIQPNDDYSLAFDPMNILEQLGLYLGFGLNLAYDPLRSEGAAQILGGLLLIASIAGMLRVLWRPSSARSLRVAAFGMATFMLALGPVIFLPDHQQSYYIGIAGFGLTLALVGLLLALRTRLHPLVATGAFSLVLLLTHSFSVNALVHQTEEFRLFDGGSEHAAGWLYTLYTRAESGFVTQFVVPADDVTFQVFGKMDGTNEAYQMLICPWYVVRRSENLANEKEKVGRTILATPWRLPQERTAGRSWAWLENACPDCNACGLANSRPCPPACYRDAILAEARDRRAAARAASSASEGAPPP